MNENARKWIAALRSGKYQQARGKLRSSYGFCCLGVACDLYGKEYGVKWTEGDWTFLDQGTSLPDLVAEWLGLATLDGGRRCWPNVGPPLTELNDLSGYTFGELADYIESQPDGLFRETINDFSDRLLPEREGDMPAVPCVRDNETVGCAWTIRYHNHLDAW